MPPLETTTSSLFSDDQHHHHHHRRPSREDDDDTSTCSIAGNKLDRSVASAPDGACYNNGTDATTSTDNNNSNNNSNNDICDDTCTERRTAQYQRSGHQLQQHQQQHQQQRRVCFALESNETYEYPAVTQDEHHLVWYSEDDELAFLLSTSPRHDDDGDGIPGATKGRTAIACGASDFGGGVVCSDDADVLLRALQLGSLVVRGVCLRAVLLGHAIATEIYDREGGGANATATDTTTDTTTTNDVTANNRRIRRRRRCHRRHRQQHRTCRSSR